MNERAPLHLDARLIFGQPKGANPMPNDKDMLEEIRQSLLKAGYSQTWIDSVFPDKRSGPDLAREQFISWLEAGECSHADTLALYDQLQHSREENERLSADREFWMNLWQQERELSKGQKDTLREINERIGVDAEKLLVENERLRGELADSKEHCSAFESLWTEAKRELEQVKAERDKLIERLRWYANKFNYIADYNLQSNVVRDNGHRARDILREIGVTGE